MDVRWSLVPKCTGKEREQLEEGASECGKPARAFARVRHLANLNTIDTILLV